MVGIRQGLIPAQRQSFGLALATCLRHLPRFPSHGVDVHSRHGKMTAECHGQSGTDRGEEVKYRSICGSSLMRIFIEHRQF